MSLTFDITCRLAGTFSLEARSAISPGITIVFGRSGSGKTTLLRAIAGLAPAQGRITAGDRVLLDSASTLVLPPQRRRVGFVFQQLALFPHLTARANIEYGLANMPVDARTSRVNAIAQSFGIAHLLDRKPPAISGGERQRVALARALVTDPDVLLLDEPLSALDHATQSHIIADLRRWNETHAIPVLYVTHAHREAFSLGERVIVLDNGRVVADGVPHEVLESPSQEPVARLAGFENLFDATVTALHHEAGTMECRIGGTACVIEVPYGEVPSGAEVRLAIRAGDILVGTVLPQGLSARNILPGTIQSLRREGARVVAIVDAGGVFEVHLTPGATSSLALSPGRAVWLVIKTHSFRRVST